MLLAPAICQAEIDGTKAGGILGQEICIVDNSYTAADFRDAYERRIRAKGYTTRLVQEKTACPVTTTLVATYGRTAWGRYLQTAMFTVLRDGEEIAVVRYRGSRHKPFKGTVEGVIGEMVDVLYP
jgi:aspartyl/asparaginyl beta-hydroxylase (cupin superfamily)